MLQSFSGSFVNHIFREENFIEHYIARWTFIFNISGLVPHVIHLTLFFGPQDRGKSLPLVVPFSFSLLNRSIT